MYTNGARARTFAVLFFPVLLLALAAVLLPQDAEAKVNPRLDPSAAGKIISVSGDAQVLSAGRSVWKDTFAGQLVYPGDSIRTGRNGKVSLLMADETLMQLNRNTNFLLKEVDRNAGWFGASVLSKFKSVTGSLYEVVRGKIWARNKNRSVAMRFKTPSVTAGVRGTELTIDVADDGSVTTSIQEGSVEHTNAFGSVVANAGEQVLTKPGAAPTKSLIVNPLEAVQWTLAIPPVDLVAKPSAVPGVPAGELDAIHRLMGQGNYADALDRAEKLAAANDSADLKVLVAVLQIYNGNPLVAKNLLDPAGGDDDAYWRASAVSALMLSENEAALDAATKAVDAAPDKAVNHIVKANVHLSRSELDQARASAEMAQQASAPGSSENISARILLAKIDFGSGYNDRAWQQLLSAQKLAPDDAELNNLAGYILIAMRDLESSDNAFNKALESDPGLAEPHMGLGIIAMRQGDADRALEEMTTAVALEPQRSLFLSYWGKMLYQVQRFDKALDIFAHAGKLDPNDPTPDFYRAIILRDLNRQGEAIEAMNTAIAKNDNRSVYRSRFLLDEDLAVRNVDLSILYERLGLSRWAESKAVAAIKSDYTNYTAHLFYAGALSDDEDRSYVFGSETLLARLMLPANANSFNTFNEYTTLFEQPDVGGQVTVGAGTQKTATGQAVAYGAVPNSNFAWNLGVFGDTTDGWRETNFEKNAAVAFLGKWQPTESNGVFVSTQFSNFKQGDKRYPRYAFDDPASPEDRLNLDLAGVELGYHHNASPGDDFLAYVTWQGTSGDQFMTESALAVPPALYTETDTTSEFERPYTQLQLQYMKKAGRHQVIAGAVGYSGETTLKSVEQIDAVDRGTVPPTVTPLFTNTLDNTRDIKFISVYAQDNWNISRNWHLEAALYFDKMDNANVVNGDTWTMDEINPRLGVIWSPGRRHTLRLAGFRYMLPFVSSRTDPTEVAGIPIFRNTVEGTQTEEYNFVWEYEQSYGLYTFGLFTLDKSNQVDAANILEGEESGGSLGLDMLLTKSVGLFANYRYEDVQDPSDPTIDRKDHLVRVGLKHQSPGGLSAGIAQLYRATRFESNRPDEDIPITDLEVGYEFADKAGRIDLFVLNVFDEEFNWVTDRFTLIGRNPAREVLLTATVNF